MDCENMFSEYTVLEKTRFFRIKGFGKIRIRKCGFEEKLGFGKIQF